MLIIKNQNSNWDFIESRQKTLIWKPCNKLHRRQKCPLQHSVLISQVVWNLLGFNCFKNSRSEVFYEEGAVQTQNSQ